MSVEAVTRKGGVRRFRVRWREGGHNRARSFERKRDAELFEAELRRRRQLGTLASLDAGSHTLDEYVTRTWAPTFFATLAPGTRSTYAELYDVHIAPTLSDVPLRQLNAEVIGRWQSDRLAAGAGPERVRKALTLLGSILQRATEAERIPTNPARLVRKAPPPARREVVPLAPITVEVMRQEARRSARWVGDGHRDATLLSVLAYAGLRPGEALALRWSDVRENTLLVQRAIALGEAADSKTHQHRSVRLLAALRADLAEWRLASGRPPAPALVFPAREGGPWSLSAYQSWRRHAFRRCRIAARAGEATPYSLRHSFASLLLYEGRSVIYVGRQLGHKPKLTLDTYGHVIDELEDAPRVAAEEAIRQAREGGLRRRAIEPGS